MPMHVFYSFTVRGLATGCQLGESLTDIPSNANSKAGKAIDRRKFNLSMRNRS